MPRPQDWAVSKQVVLPTAIPALLLAVLLLLQWRSTACSFQESSPGSGFFLCHQRLLGWDVQSVLARITTRQGWFWGRRQVDHWVLVDAGASDTLLFGGHASSLVKGVARALAPPRRGAQASQLDLIILTHAHSVGALHKLLDRYPNALVAAHEDEVPFLVGSPPLPSVNASASTTLRVAGAVGLLPSLGRHGVPPERLVVLRGEGDDLADSASKADDKAAREALRWLPRGVLSWTKVGAHTPGSIAVLHAPSGAMLAGDAVAPTSSWLGGLGGGLQVEPHAAPAEAAAQRAAAKRLIMQGGFEWLLPMHGGNFSREQAQALVQSWPDEAPQPEAGQAAEQQGGADGGDAGAAMVGEEQGGGVADTAAAGLGLSPGKGDGVRSSLEEKGVGVETEPGSQEL